LALTVVLVIATILGKNDYPSAFVACAGLILYKTVKQGVEERGS
jgi:hypothetical protein